MEDILKSIIGGAAEAADKLERALRAVIQSMAQRVRPEEG